METEVTKISKDDDGSGYLLYHSIGMFREKGQLIADALAHFARKWGTPDDAQWPHALRLRQDFIDRWRSLIGAPEGTLTTAENVTTALFALINSLPPRLYRGRRLLVAADCFPSLHFLLSGMAERHGFVLDTVPLRPGESWVRDEDVIAHWQEDVSIALLTSVTSTASHRCDLDVLVSHGRKMGTLIGIDITQSIGLLPFDVTSTPADFVVSTSLKWLCGTSGAGILYVREGLLQDCKPQLRGWFSQDNIFSWDIDAFAYANDARRFDNGTPSLLACVGTIPALEWYAGQNAEDLQSHNRELANAILDAARSLGLTTVCPSEDARRGGSVMLRLAEDDMPRVLQTLRAVGVYADGRGDTLRLSPGNLTTPDGVERLTQVLAKVAG